MTDRTCAQCGATPWGDDPFCGRCGTAFDESDSPVPREISLGDNVRATTRSDPAAASGHPLRVLLGLGAAMVLGVVALSVLNSFGDDSATTEDAAASGMATDPTPEPTSTPTAEPTTTPTAKPTPTAPSSRSGETNTGDDPASVIPGWSRLTDLYNGGGVLGVRTRSNQIVLVDLATGQTADYDVPSPPAGFGFLDQILELQATSRGHVSSRLGAVVITPWDGSADIEIPLDSDQLFRPRIVSVSEDHIVTLKDNLISPGDLEMFVHRVDDRSTTTVDLPPTAIDMLYPWSPAGLNPLLLQGGSALHRFTLDLGWTELGKGRLIAESEGGVLLETCEPVDGDLACTHSTVGFDGKTTAVHPTLAELQISGANLSDDLAWAAVVEFEVDPTVGEIVTLVLVELATGRSQERDLTLEGRSSPGVWLPNSSLFAYVGHGEPFRIIDAASGRMTEFADVPWSTNSSSEGPPAARILMMDFPVKAPDGG